MKTSAHAKTEASVAAGRTAVIVPADASRLETLAAREIVRYLYLRTGILLPVVVSDTPPAGDAVVVARKGRPLASGAGAGLQPQEYLLKTVGAPGFTRVLVVGGDDIGTLYAAYRFAEHLGVRFYMHGDVVPDARIALALPKLNETGKPLFDTRGIQLYYDFPEGPDWWDRDDHLAYIAQLAKMRMNFCGFHCYSQSEEMAEPAVWIGAPRDLDASGEIRFAGPSQWANTARNSPWSYAPMKTDDFCAGAAALFAEDDFGPEVMKGLMPRPGTPKECVELFARTGKMFHRAFALARALGVRTCVGTETPLSITAPVKARLQQEGRNPDDPAIVREVYAAMFRRIAALYPVDYYWLWTDESWTWAPAGETSGQFQAVAKDMQAALDALDSLGNPFTLAISGWVLGPRHDRTAFDKILPKKCPISCINRYFGYEPLDTGFAEILDRPKWAIPWLENDPNLSAPQPWVGRMRYDAADAKRLGCTGLLGVLWRTKILSGNISALAMSGWDLSWVPAGFDATPVNRSVHFPGPQGENRGFARLNASVSDTTEAPVYQTVCSSMSAYHLAVPDGIYAVTLKFNEAWFAEAGKRVFGVNLQGKQVVEKLDICARAGKDRAFDYTCQDIVVADGWLRVDFIPILDVPLIAGIVVEGKTAAGKPLVKKVNCGGKAYKDYEADTPLGFDRTMPVEAFYVDFAKAHFGDEIGEAAGKILAENDGVNLPEPSWWFPGPGAIWHTRTDVKAMYGFVEELAALRASVKGAGNLARFDYWLNTYRYMAAMACAGDTRARLNEALDALRKETGQAKRKALASKALAIRLELARAWEEIMTRQLEATDTPGELGTLANLEQHNRRHLKFVSGHDAEIEKFLGKPLPAEARVADTYAGAARIIVPTVRTLAEPGETLTLKVMILSPGVGKEDAGAPAGALYWRALGIGRFVKTPLRHVARRVYRATVLVPEKATAIEYYIKAEAGNSTLVWPATAPGMNQTVVISGLTGK